MASVMQGDAYNIPVTIKSGNGTLITPEIAACVEITVGQFTKRWPGQVTFDEKTGEWQFPVTQKQTFRFLPGTAMVQARVVFQDGSIMGGSGAPVRVEQSASRGTLPQPEKTEAATGSAPKATEVTIPTVHDIDVSLHSQVILSDPIKAPYIGENGNWYEYDAETGTFVDTGTSASGIPPIAPDTAGKYLTNDGSKAEWGVMSGGTDLSLGITSAQVGQIVKITAVDTDGKPTKWQAVNDRLPEVTPSDDGKALYVERIGEYEYGYGFTNIPNIHTFIPLGITDASPGQFARIKFVDDIGQPTKWEPVDIPSGGTDISLGLTAATVGQTIKVKAVNTDGKPTAWSPADLPKEKEWRILRDIMITSETADQTQNVTYYTNDDGQIKAVEFSVDEDGNAFSVSELVIIGMIENLGATGTGTPLALFSGKLTDNQDIMSIREGLVMGQKQAVYAHCYALFGKYEMTDFYSFQMRQKPGFQGSLNHLSNNGAFHDLSKLLDSWKAKAAPPYTTLALGTGGVGISGRVVFFAR